MNTAYAIDGADRTQIRHDDRPVRTADIDGRPMHPLATTLMYVTRVFSAATARWTGSQPELRQRIYFSNHASHADFLVILGALPKKLRAKTRAVGARDYWAHSRLSRYVANEVFRMVLIERGCHAHLCHHNEKPDPTAAAIEPMLRALDQGNSLVVFPEGTRGEGPEIAPFRSGLYHLARFRPEVELIPVYLRNVNRMLPKGEFLPIPSQCSVAFGPGTHLQAAEPRREFLRRMREAIYGLKVGS